MEPISVGLVVVNESGIIAALDGPTERFGIMSDAVGQPWDEAFAPWDVPVLWHEDASALPCRLFATSPTGEPVSMEFFRIPVSKDSSPGAAGAEKPSIIVHLRGDLAHSIPEKQQQLCSLGELAAGVAHEMNNALTLVVGWLDLLFADMPEGDSRRDTLELLMNESMRVSKLTNNLLEVARGAGAPPQPLDVSQILEEVLALVRNEMHNSNIKLESRLPPELPAIRGTSARLKQALLNLLLNARQAMPSGGRVTISADVDEDSFVRVAVEDTGCGIPQDVQAQIFNPFFTTKKNGTGLGLSVTRRIVEDHGGSIQLESRPGSGARFTMRLPVMVE